MLPKVIRQLIQNPDTPNCVIVDAIKEHSPRWPDGDDMATIYVVRGETGEYGDRNAWDVAAFLDPDAAQGLCDKLTEWCKEMRCHDEDDVGDYYDLVCPWDENFRCQYTGVKYYIARIPLKEA